jgi:putative component of membrane protein insertase Oxa1/YidC/SpoIIIJ protein YidD
MALPQLVSVSPRLVSVRPAALAFSSQAQLAPASNLYQVQRTAQDDVFQADTKTPAYMTGMTPDDLVNPTYSVAQRTSLKMIAWYQRKTRRVDDKGHIHNTHGMCCRYYPSCSTYTAQAIKKYGFVRGVLKGFVRTGLKCNPIQPLTHEYGFYQGVKIAGRSLLAKISRSLGVSNTLFSKELAQCTAVYDKVAQGVKTVDMP